MGHDHAGDRAGNHGGHDDVECREVLKEVYLFLDGEDTDHTRATIQQHLDDCTPCLRRYGIEREVKALVARCCGQEVTPPGLQERIRVALSQTTVSAGGATATVTEVEVIETW